MQEIFYLTEGFPCTTITDEWLLVLDGFSTGEVFVKYTFPNHFIFGAATASYQIEGAWDADGKGLSIWDEMCRRKGKIRDGQTGNIACDHYHRYVEDVGLIQQLGLDAYRFSLSWPRILPEGVGEINQKGLDFYDRLVDSLLETGVTPYTTLFHWDLPLSLQKKYGGFQSRQCSDDFAEYAKVVAERLGDRVKHWITTNEIQMHALMGYFLGIHAPGKHKPWKYFSVIHNQLLAHGKATQVIKSIWADAKVGSAQCIAPVYPMKDTAKDRHAAYMASQFFSGVTIDPILKGEYPKELMKKLRWFFPKIQSGDMDIISTSTDFFGINNYHREKAMYKWYIPILKAWLLDEGSGRGEFVENGIEHTTMGWEVFPDSLYEAIMMVKNANPSMPIYVTENGAAYTDEVTDNSVHDQKRIRYIERYLHAVHRACDDGADVRGYFCWTLMDNFEWAEGFHQRFGLIHVDQNTQERIIKDSGYWYRDMISRHRGESSSMSIRD